ncbi:MAG: hypothetical protein D6781_07335 [Verrucomicrobia bacterium]|nr:MAG: hypothetical protein D6781_07335 [Verrucomicrobiota bacterium]
MADIQLASMTELPVTKQGFADQLSAVRGQGRAGIRAARHCLLTGGASTFSAVPSSATGFANGFGGLVRYFPPGKAEIAAIEGRFWEEVLGPDAAREALVFEDQYASTGGQIYELVTGRDLMVADIRPLVFARLGYGEALSCHPYDLCTALILEEAGGVIEHPVHRGQVDAPLDTVTPVAWAGYANRTLADRAAPVLARLLDAFGR